MAEWVTHLWVADEVLKRLPWLDRHGFCVGNIAPDCNLLNEEGTDFVPSREVTHWMNGRRKTADDSKEFYDKYVLSRMDDIKTTEELSFLLGYYSHLITDAEIQRIIRDPGRVAAAWERIKKVPELTEKAAGQPEDWDTVKRLFPKDDRMKDFFSIEREYLDAHPDSGWYTEIKGLEYFPDYIDYLPKQSIPKKIKMMYYEPLGEQSMYPYLAFSKEEYTDFVERAIALVTDALKDADPSLKLS
ncbi:MAG: zinc dependent phospholipase C family protein [Lachnospiraceae bacterium]|nr:zinc dependent phospholipase C family protein [Lachnospiraceae bacterium]